MPVTLDIDGAAGKAGIYSAAQNNDILANPDNYRGIVRAHSDFNYIGVVAVYTGSFTYAQVARGDYQAQHAHGLNYQPMVLATVNFGGNDIPVCASLIIGRSTLFVASDATNVYLRNINHYSAFDSQPSGTYKIYVLNFGVDANNNPVYPPYNNWLIEPGRLRIGRIDSDVDYLTENAASGAIAIPLGEQIDIEAGQNGASDAQPFVIGYRNAINGYVHQRRSYFFNSAYPGTNNSFTASITKVDQGFPPIAGTSPGDWSLASNRFYVIRNDGTTGFDSNVKTLHWLDLYQGDLTIPRNRMNHVQSQNSSPPSQVVTNIAAVDSRATAIIGMQYVSEGAFTLSNDFLNSGLSPGNFAWNPPDRWYSATGTLLYRSMTLNAWGLSGDPRYITDSDFGGSQDYANLSWSFYVEGGFLKFKTYIYHPDDRYTNSDLNGLINIKYRIFTVAYDL